MLNILKNAKLWDDKELEREVYNLSKVIRPKVGEQLKGNNLLGLELNSEVLEMIDYVIVYFEENRYIPSFPEIYKKFNSFKFLSTKYESKVEFKNYFEEKKAFYLDRIRISKLRECQEETSAKKQLELLDDVSRIVSEKLNSVIELKCATQFNWEKDFKESKVAEEGPKTNITSIDTITGGITAGKLMIVAAPPKCLKTMFLINMCHEGIIEYEPDNNTLFISLEISEKELMQKLIIRHSKKFNSKLDIKVVIKNKLTEDEKKEFLRVADDFKKSKKHDLFILDGTKIQTESLIALRQQISDFIEKYNIKTIMIDYMQMFKNFNYRGYTNRYDQLNDIVSLFHVIEIKYNVRVILASQITREGQKMNDTQKGKNKKAGFQPYHLSEVSNLEKYAYYIIFLDTDEVLKKSNQFRYQLSRHRDGETIEDQKCAYVDFKYFYISESGFTSLEEQFSIPQDKTNQPIAEIDLFD
jgi:replicative DNA helicase